MQVAINIKTQDWSFIIETLITEKWEIKSKYQGVDAGIDFDFLALKRGNQKILFAWDNWNEGEISCTNKLFCMLSQKFKLDFEYGKPKNLTLFSIIMVKISNFLVHFYAK